MDKDGFQFGGSYDFWYIDYIVIALTLNYLARSLPNGQTKFQYGRSGCAFLS